MAYENGAKLVIVNQQPTAMDGIADLVIHAGLVKPCRLCWPNSDSCHGRVLPEAQAERSPKQPDDFRSRYLCARHHIMGAGGDVQIWHWGGFLPRLSELVAGVRT